MIRSYGFGWVLRCGPVIVWLFRPPSLGGMVRVFGRQSRAVFWR